MMALNVNHRKIERFLFFTIPVAILLASTIAMSSTDIYSILLVNLGWVNLTKAVMHDKPQQQQLLEHAKVQFNLAKEHFPKTPYRGLGIVELWSHKPNAAVDIWRAGDVSADWLLAMGKTRYALGDLNGALTYLMGAEALAEDQTHEASERAGIICQRTYAESHLLSDGTQEYCRRFFSRQSGNLIVNGSFASGGASSWQPSLSGQEVAWTWGLDYDQGQPAPSMVMFFHDPERNMGLYQRISLFAGTTVRFGAWLRVEATVPGFEARVLHIQYQRQGKSPGNSLVTLDDTTGWTYFEREFRLPEDSYGLVTFLPVLGKGKGVVWMDDVTVTVVKELQ